MSTVTAGATLEISPLPTKSVRFCTSDTSAFPGGILTAAHQQQSARDERQTKNTKFYLD